MDSQMSMLSNKFNSLLLQYKETYNEFLNSTSSNDNSYKSLPNYTFVGAKNIKTIQSISLDNCIESCSKNKLCSGATFDNQKQICYLNSGSGEVINSQNKTAIINKFLYYSYKLKKINDELKNVITNMIILTNSNINNYKLTEKINAEKSNILQNNYKILKEEGLQIEEMIKQYEKLNTAYEDARINTTSNYYNYIMYLLIAILLIILLLTNISKKEQLGGGVNYSKFYPIIFLILGLIIIVNSILKN